MLYSHNYIHAVTSTYVYRSPVLAAGLLASSVHWGEMQSRTPPPFPESPILKARFQVYACVFVVGVGGSEERGKLLT
jgi:hypothetical protein